jgi:hypothetical protein
MTKVLDNQGNHFSLVTIEAEFEVDCRTAAHRATRRFILKPDRVSYGNLITKGNGAVSVCDQTFITVNLVFTFQSNVLCFKYNDNAF